MLLAVRRRLAALDVEARSRGAGVSQAASAVDVNRALFSMFLAVNRGVATIVVEAGNSRAEVT